VFEAIRTSALEIHTGMMASAILSDTIPCDRLQINEGPYSNLNRNRSRQEAQGDRTAIAGRPQIPRNLRTFDCTGANRRRLRWIAADESQ
jgi:hypothetical protein